MQDVFVGTWRLKPERSQFDPLHRPAAATMVFERDSEGHYRMQAEGRKENGEMVVERPVTFVPDGSEQAVPGFESLKVASTLPDPRTIRYEARREDGSIAGGGAFVVSADGESLAATTFGVDSQLRQFEQRTVWEREG